jgi:hypothetical protein
MDLTHVRNRVSENCSSSAAPSGVGASGLAVLKQRLSCLHRWVAIDLRGPASAAKERDDCLSISSARSPVRQV